MRRLGAPVTRAPGSHIGLALVISLALTRGIVIAGFVPPFQGPDEPAHTDYVQRLVETRRLPEARFYCDQLFSPESIAVDRAFGLDLKFRPNRPVPPLAAYAPPRSSDVSSRMTTGCGASSSYPPLYYATAATAYATVHDRPFLQRLFAARLASVGWGILTAVLAYLLGVWWFGAAAHGVLLGIIVPGQPMIAFLSSVVNNDAAVYACATGVFAAIARIRADPDGRSGFVLLSASALVGVLSKPNFTFYLPVFAACTAVALGVRHRKAWITTTAAFTPAFLGQLAWSVHTRDTARDLFGRTKLDIGVFEWLSRHVLVPERQWVVWAKQQYWMSWGWLDTDLASGYYVALQVTVALAVLGMFLGWRLLDRRDKAIAIAAAGATVYGIVAIHAFEFRYLRATGMEFLQGRYLLIVFPLQAIALVTGLRALSRRFGSSIDGAWAFAMVLLVVDSAAIARGLTRWYGT
jgi:hypothetical protein